MILFNRKDFPVIISSKLNAWWLMCRAPMMQAWACGFRRDRESKGLIACQPSDCVYTRCAVVFCSIVPVPAFPVKKTFLLSFTRSSTCCCKYILRLSLFSDTLARSDERNRRLAGSGQSRCVPAAVTKSDCLPRQIAKQLVLPAPLSR